MGGQLPGGKGPLGGSGEPDRLDAEQDEQATLFAAARPEVYCLFQTLLFRLLRFAHRQCCCQSISDYSTAREDLHIKEGELEKSRATLEGIAIEYQRLQTNLQKVFLLALQRKGFKLLNLFLNFADGRSGIKN